MSTVITVENLGKKYTLHHQQREQYTALRDALSNGVVSLGKKLIRPFRCSPVSCPMPNDPTVEDFWALKDVSFEVKQGDRIGIIGRNGAGKSTLLKILSRITEPTTGSVRIKGRVASLLEVGTGFHPELTGRENIFLNGAILGMSRTEIRKKFDEIVDFAEIEKFLDTPVKRYSSGMYVRLAFAVAAHLEPEILVIDEVLAVGDAQFQKKCLGKMEDVSTKEGRTVLFVSHNLQAVRQLCSRCLLLNKGMLVVDETVDETIAQYLNNTPLSDNADMEGYIGSLPSDPSFRLESVKISQEGAYGTSVGNGTPVTIDVYYRVMKKTTGLRVFIDVLDNEQMLLFRSFHDGDGDGIGVMHPGFYRSQMTIPADLLAPKRYHVCVLATVFNERMCIPYPGLVLSLEVERTGRNNRAYFMEPIRGKIAPYIPWTTSIIGSDRGFAC
jgi:lipopolysaccharide transport system ATP-binding protein